MPPRSSRQRKRSVIVEPTLGADRTLALSYIPARNRAALAALFAIDAAMGDVVRTSSDPMLGQIRLAWWRERLEELDQGVVPAEPRLQAVAEALIPKGISGRDAAALEGGWLKLFTPFPWDVSVVEILWFRGRLLFGLGAKLLSRTDDRIEAAGGLWAIMDAARHCSDPPSRKILMTEGRTLARGLGGTKVEPALRPLSILAALAIRDLAKGEPFEPEGSPGRIATMLGHRLSGKLPKLG